MLKEVKGEIWRKAQGHNARSSRNSGKTIENLDKKCGVELLCKQSENELQRFKGRPVMKKKNVSEE